MSQSEFETINNILDIWRIVMKAMVDPYNTITNLAKVESRLKQLADPAASHKDEDIEKGAEAHAKEKIDELIEKKKAMIADGTANTAAKEYKE